MREIRRQFNDYLPKRAPTRVELGWLLMPALVAAVLLAFDRFGVEHRFAERFGARLVSAGVAPQEFRFYAQLWLSGACVLLMVLVPALYLRFFPPDSGRQEWALRFEGRHLPLYGVLFLLMLPVVCIAAAMPNFNQFYPLYNPSSLNRWLLFELVYLTQFFCVEFFFRGPLLLRAHDKIGHAAIGAMVIPYALIHIYKPFPEALGSIVAGYLLGFLAVRIRSIWPGVFLHCGVALSMDLFAMLQSGRLAALVSG